MEIKIDELKKVLLSFANRTNACDESIRRIKSIKNLNGFKSFIYDYESEIDDRVLLSYTHKEEFITPENIIQYFESPFISDYDKNRIKEIIWKR